MYFLLEKVNFHGYVSFREGTTYNHSLFNRGKEWSKFVTLANKKPQAGATKIASSRNGKLNNKDRATNHGSRHRHPPIYLLGKFLQKKHLERLYCDKFSRERRWLSYMH